MAAGTEVVMAADSEAVLVEAMAEVMEAVLAVGADRGVTADKVVMADKVVTVDKVVTADKVVTVAKEVTAVVAPAVAAEVVIAAVLPQLLLQRQQQHTLRRMGKPFYYNIIGTDLLIIYLLTQTICVMSYLLIMQN